MPLEVLPFGSLGRLIGAHALLCNGSLLASCEDEDGAKQLCNTQPLSLLPACVYIKMLKQIFIIIVVSLGLQRSSNKLGMCLANKAI